MKNLFTGIFMMVLMGGTLPVQADDGDIDLGYLQLHDDSVYVTEALTGWWRDAKETFDVRMSWYKEAKFGGFIHWGAYSPFGGSFQGNPPDGGYAEHLMRMHRIPVATYNEEVVKTFNPTRFNATEWVAKIKQTGMKYVIITAKHHDGFAIYPSDAYQPAPTYPSYDASCPTFDIRRTPFHTAASPRDPIAELRAACQAAGLKFGIYYSQALDWEHPFAPGNDWDNFSAINGFPQRNPGGNNAYGGANWWMDNTYKNFMPVAKVNNHYLLNWRQATQEISWNVRVREATEFNLSLAFRKAAASDAGVVTVNIDGVDYDINYTSSNSTANRSTYSIGKISLSAGNHVIKLKGKTRTSGAEYIRPLELTLEPVVVWYVGTWPGKMDDLFELYMERVRADNIGSRNATTISSTVTSALTFWQSDGRFSDINYSNTNGSSQDWESIKHVARLRDFAFAYTMSGSAYYESDDLFNKIVTSLTSWVNNHPPACANWWFNQIPEPQYLGLALIQMRIGKNKISSSLETQVCNYMRTHGGTPGVPNANSGANRMDVALHWFYRACLTKNETELQKAMTEYYAELQIMNVGSEGLQADGSFFQHGQQFYIGGYGDVFVSGALLLGGYTAGTPYAMNAAQTKILGDFARGSYFYTMRGRYHSWGLGGRGYLGRPGAIRKGPSYAQRLIPIDPDHAEEYNSIIARINETEPPSYNITPSNKHFYIGDYTAHSRPKYLFDVRMASTRTVRIEYGNYENLRTFFAPDGCTNILRTGKEYENIFPVWNWARVPGITCPQVPNASIPLSRRDMNQPGISTFAGGVSDSLYAVTAYSYGGGHTGNSAKKGWFFFDNEVVCLGSDITSVVPSNTYVRDDNYSGIISQNWMTAADQFDINTTVNQCLLKDDVLVSVESAVSTLAAGSEQAYSTPPDWVLHDKIGYFFPSGGNVSVSNKTQSGSWYDINRSQSSSTLSQNVFSLWFNHGKPAVKADYAYIVVPEIDNAAGMDAYRAAGEVEILVNSDSVQAVRHKATGVLGIIFYKAATLENGIAVKADRECAVLLKPASGNTFTMHVADPAHKATPVTINTRIPATESAWTTTTCSGLSSGASKVYTVTGSAALTYTAAISPGGTHAFADAAAGYETQAAQKFVITNTGTGNLTNVQATISAGGSHFEISESLSSTIIALDGGKATVSVRPKNGLAVGDYTGALNILGDNGLSLSVNLFIRVSKTPSGLAEVSAIDPVNVYSSEGLIRVVSCPTNRIREVLIYDLQGSLLHTTGRLYAIACSIEKKLLTGVYVIKVVAEKNTQNVELVVR